MALASSNGVKETIEAAKSPKPTCEMRFLVEVEVECDECKDDAVALNALEVNPLRFFGFGVTMASDKVETAIDGSLLTVVSVKDFGYFGNKKDKFCS